MSKYQGSCYCKSCEFECRSTPLFRTTCHCSICARISGGIAVSFVGFEDDNLILTKGREHLRVIKTSESMERFFCTICSSNVYNQSLIPDRAFRDTPLMNFQRDTQGNILHIEELQPESHIFFSRCQKIYAPLFKSDKLPKFSEMPGSSRMD